MKYSKPLALLLVLILAVSMLAGCAGTGNTAAPSPSASVPAETTSPDASPETASPSADGKAVTFTDMTGKEISLDAPAEKIVALTAADCEILCAIGAKDTIVGRGVYCDYPEDIAGITAVESGSETNIEQIISLAPQVVVMSTMDQTTDQIAQLEKAGIACVVSNASDIAGVYTAIEMLGKLTGRDADAAALTEQMRSAFKGLESGAASTGKTVYFEVSPLEYGLWTAGSGTFMDEIATMLGLKNAFADVTGWAEISEEQVIERNPDYIVTITMYFGEGQTPVEEIMARPGWDGITAVKNSAVYNADSNAISRPGPRLTDAAVELSDFISKN